jgi:hypothetical protein
MNQRTPIYFFLWLMFMHASMHLLLDNARMQLIRGLERHTEVPSHAPDHAVGRRTKVVLFTILGTEV